MSEWQFLPYQVEDAEKIYRARYPGRMYVAHQMRVGKTGTALKARQLLAPRRTLIVAGTNAQLSWFEKCPKFDIEPPVLITGTAEQRQKLWLQGHDFVIATKETLYQDIKAGLVPNHYDMGIVDESHKLIRRTGKILDRLQTIDFDYLLPMTGSPLRKGIQDAWSILNWLSPKDWSSYWKYVDKYCITNYGSFNNKEILGPKDMAMWSRDISPYLIRRLRKDIGLPEKVREIEPIVMTQEQSRLYWTLWQEMILNTKDVLTIAPNTAVKLMYLRQLLVCPQLLDPAAEDGAVMEWMLEKLEEMDSKHCVIMTPFPESGKWYKKRLQAEGYTHVFQIGSGMKLAELQLAIKRFRQTKGIMICSVKFAEGFDLAPAEWGMFAGYEWDLDSNHQAEDRLYGVGTKSVLWFYPKHKGTMDEEMMLPCLDTKVRNTEGPLKTFTRLVNG